jgi:hypothetical protein
MVNKIAIIDFINQDVGLKILFPESDYFILEQEFDRTRINKKYNIIPIIHNKDVNVFEAIKTNYDNLFIIAPIYGYSRQKKEKHNNYLIMLIDLIKSNKFKNICFFDNNDYDYDPNNILGTEFIKEKNIKYFKRYYNKEKIYNKNVHPFPYIIFGHQCNIEMITDLFYKNKSELEKISRIFFSGTPFIHVDNEYGIIRNRREMIMNIENY